MRKWIIIGAVLFVFCAIVVLALLNLNSLINRNKDYFLGQAEQALGRKVSVGDVGVTLWGGVGLTLSNFTMSDDPSFSSSHFVSAEDLQINVKLLPLLRKDFQVKRLILHKPVIQVIRNKEGRFNFSTVGQGEKGKTERAGKGRKGKRAEDSSGFIDRRGRCLRRRSALRRSKGRDRFSRQPDRFQSERFRSEPAFLRRAGGCPVF